MEKKNNKSIENIQYSLIVRYIFLNYYSTINTCLLLSPSSIGTYCPSSDSCIGISKPVTGSINVVVSEVVEDDEDVDNKEVDS